MATTQNRIRIPAWAAAAAGLVASCWCVWPLHADGAASTPTTTLESLSTDGRQGNLYSYAIAISARGRYVLFSSDATNLVAGDTNEQSDAFLRDRWRGVTTRVSVSSSGAQAAQTADGFGGSRAVGMSRDGRWLLFRSDAPNLVAHDTNGVQDMFVHDRRSGATERVSVGRGGRQANGASWSASISADGRYVAFTSSASNLVAHDTNGAADVFLYDRLRRTTSRASVGRGGRQSNGDSTEPAISAHGRFIAFQSNASNLVARDTDGVGDVFVRDRRSGRTARVSVASDGAQAAGFATGTGSNGPAISAHGRFVAFHSDAANLVRHDSNGVFDIFVHDRATGRTLRVSVRDDGGQADAESLGPATISPDGRYVAFASLASNLVAGDRNDTTDAFIRDLLRRHTLLASRSATGEQGSDASTPAALSTDDRYLAFSSWAGNLVAQDRSPGPDVFVRSFGGLPR
jgi:Tol biopolymer transport system component